MSFLIIFIGALVLIGLYILSTYNKFVTTKTRIKASVQEIGNQLKRQSNLIPNLIASVKGYMKHEKSVMKMLTDARKQVTSALKSNKAQKLIDASAQLENALQPIRIVLESNPQLKAAGPTQNLMDELRDTADKVMYSRRTLIDLSADYNVMVKTMPSALVAMLFKFVKEEGLKMPEAGGEALSVSEKEMKNPKVNL